MAKVIETIATLNSAARTLIAILLLALVSMAGWSAYSQYYSKDLEAKKLAERIAITEASLAAQSKLLAEKDREISKLGTSLKLLKMDHRLARISVVDQKKGASGDVVESAVEFVELNDEGNPISEPRKFTITGDVVYIDNWIVKFDDKYVEEAVVDRSTSLCLFRRIFGEHQNPSDGFALDVEGKQPQAYARGGETSEFEKNIWRDFWEIANDEKKAHDLGIRAAHGQAVSIKVQSGKTYKIVLRSSDGLSIQPDHSKR